MALSKQPNKYNEITIVGGRGGGGLECLIYTTWKEHATSSFLGGRSNLFSTMRS